MAIDVNGSRVTFGGLSSGLDTSALIDALIQVERIPLRRLESRKGDLEDQQGRFRELNSLLLTLREKARAVDNQTIQLSGPSVDEEFLAFQATSSDETVATGTADGQGTAVPGTYNVRVEQLASVGRGVSAGYTSATDTVGQAGDTLSINFEGTQNIDITLSSGTTLQSLRDTINTDVNNDGSVRAELLDDGSGGVHLIISGTQTGAANDVVVTTTVTGPGGAAFLDPTLSQNAQDARVRVLGLTITRPSNDIDDALPGITLHLISVNDAANPNDQITLSVTRDEDAITGKLQDLIDAFNAVRSFAQKQSSVDPDTKRAGPLSGDPTVRSIDQKVRAVVGSKFSFAGSPFSYLSDIGVRFGSDGLLTLDSKTLTDALEKDSQAVRQLLSGDGTTDGAATALARSLDPILQLGDGTLALTDSSFDDRLKDLADSISRMEDRVARREEGLIEKFTQLERLVSAFQAQSSFLDTFRGRRNG